MLMKIFSVRELEVIDSHSIILVSMLWVCLLTASNKKDVMKLEGNQKIAKYMEMLKSFVWLNIHKRLAKGQFRHLKVIKPTKQEKLFQFRMQQYCYMQKSFCNLVPFCFSWHSLTDDTAFSQGASLPSLEYRLLGAETWVCVFHYRVPNTENSV